MGEAKRKQGVTLGETGTARYDAVNRAIFSLDDQGQALPPDEMMRILATQIAKVLALVCPIPDQEFIDGRLRITEQRIREAYPPMARMMRERCEQFAAMSGQDIDSVRTAMVAAFENTGEMWNFVHGAQRPQ
jgi:hypothetical protein